MLTSWPLWPHIKLKEVKQWHTQTLENSWIMVYAIYIFELIVVNIVLIDWISLTFVKYNFMFANYNKYIYKYFNTDYYDVHLESIIILDWKYFVPIGMLYNVLPINPYIGNITIKCHNKSMSENRDPTVVLHQEISTLPVSVASDTRCF